MLLSTTKAKLANIRIHPIKSLDPVSVGETRIGPAGGIALDRAWALYSVDGKWVNGKRTPAVHLIRASYALDLASVTLTVPADRRRIPRRTFAFPGEYENAAEWFPGLSVENVRQRFRTTLEIDGVPAFWEDQLFGEEERSMVRFRIGEVRFEGSNPCARCPVPPRDPCNGADLDGFQKHFTQQREATLPEGSPRERFDHFYRLATNTRVASCEAGKMLRVGDAVIAD